RRARGGAAPPTDRPRRPARRAARRRGGDHLARRALTLGAVPMTSPAPSPPERAEAPLWSPFAALALVVVLFSSFAGPIAGVYRSSHPGADLPLSVSGA